MKRLLFILTAFVLIMVSCKEKEQEEKTFLSYNTPFYRNPFEFNGKLKSFKTRSYWPKEVDGKIVKGEIVTRHERDSLNTMSDFNLEFNEEGVTTVWEFISYNNEINHYELELVDGRIMSGRWFVRGKDQSYFTCEYDEIGRLINEKYFRTGADTLIRISEFTYLEDEKFDIVKNLNPNGEVQTWDKFLYDGLGRVSEYQHYNSNDEIIYTSKVEYDDAGHFNAIIYDYPEKRHNRYEYRDLAFDDKGNIISGLIYEDDILFGVFEFIIEYYTPED
jgi:hypothetical protein